MPFKAQHDAGVHTAQMCVCMIRLGVNVPGTGISLSSGRDFVGDP